MTTAQTARPVTRQWVGEDDPHRLDAATVEFRAEGMRAMGTSRAPLWVTCWTLECDRAWGTTLLEVSSRGRGWSRELALARDGVRWSADVTVRGEGDERLDELPAPGIQDVSALDGAVDCDLGWCPLTNTMPIRRLGLLDADVGETLLTMAWVDIPSLQVIPSRQRYSSHTRAGRRVVRYESESRDFRSDLVVDELGLVRHYPQLARPFDTEPR